MLRIINYDPSQYINMNKIQHLIPPKPSVQPKAARMQPQNTNLVHLIDSLSTSNEFISQMASLLNKLNV
jgi:hypothetical protein